MRDRGRGTVEAMRNNGHISRETFVCVCMCVFRVECHLLHSYIYSDLGNILIDKTFMVFVKENMNYKIYIIN